MSMKTPWVYVLLLCAGACAGQRFSPTQNVCEKDTLGIHFALRSNSVDCTFNDTIYWHAVVKNMRADTLSVFGGWLARGQLTWFLWELWSPSNYLYDCFESVDTEGVFFLSPHDSLTVSWSSILPNLVGPPPDPHAVCPSTRRDTLEVGTYVSTWRYFDFRGSANTSRSSVEVACSLRVLITRSSAVQRRTPRRGMGPGQGRRGIRLAWTNARNAAPVLIVASVLSGRLRAYDTRGRPTEPALLRQY